MEASRFECEALRKFDQFIGAIMESAIEKLGVGLVELPLPVDGELYPKDNSFCVILLETDGEYVLACGDSSVIGVNAGLKPADESAGLLSLSTLLS